MVLVAYAGPVRPAAALRDSVLCLPTDIHSLFVNKPSSSSSSSAAPCISPSPSISPCSSHLSPSLSLSLTLPRPSSVSPPHHTPRTISSALFLPPTPSPSHFPPSSSLHPPPRKQDTNTHPHGLQSPSLEKSSSSEPLRPINLPPPPPRFGDFPLPLTPRPALAGLLPPRPPPPPRPPLPRVPEAARALAPEAPPRELPRAAALPLPPRLVPAPRPRDAFVALCLARFLGRPRAPSSESSSSEKLADILEGQSPGAFSCIWKVTR